MADVTSAPVDPGPGPRRIARRGGAGGSRWVTAVFAATGFSALTLQVTWQRVISLHSGVDLASLTTVVAAFLAGLGIGSLLAGWVADRLDRRRCLLAFAVSNAGIGLFALVSVTLFYDVYRRFAEGLDVPLRTFAFNTALVIVPTVLMGLSLPLLARAAVQRPEDAGRTIGRLYAANTLGAAAGAMVAGWWLLGSVGFVTTVRLAGGLNLAAAVVTAVMARRMPVDDPRPAPATATAPATAPATGPATGPPAARVWPWIAAYGLTGAAALALEQVFFRLVDAIMRSNSYSFGHVLGLYLLLFAVGAAIGSRFVDRTVDPRVVFCRLQLGVGISATAGLVALIRLPGLIGVSGPFDRYFTTDGFNVGFGDLSSPKGVAVLLFAFVVAPLAVMGVPVVLAGASYPFVQRIVTDRADAVGRRTGTILFANVVGNVAGTLLAGYVLIDRLGTAGTLRLLAVSLGAAGIAALWLGRRRMTGRALAAGGGGLLLLVATVVLTPSNPELWAFLQGTTTDRLTVAEHRTCATTLERNDRGEEVLHINASSQNGYPFDDFHVLIGLVPALAHPDPDRALAIGLGIGATAYGMSVVPEVGTVDVVELCAGQYDLLAGLADDGASELRRLFADPGLRTHVADGRKFLLTADERFDVITVDTLRPQSAFSGSLYSTDFYELLRDRLDAGGVVAQWVPTARVMNSITSVFPHVASVEVASYGGSPFVLAGMEPIDLSPAALQERLDGVDPVAFSPTQRDALDRFVADLAARCESTALPAADRPDWSVNRDLAPLDEYFLNNPLDVDVLSGCPPPPAGDVAGRPSR